MMERPCRLPRSTDVGAAPMFYFLLNEITNGTLRSGATDEARTHDFPSILIQ